MVLLKHFLIALSLLTFVSSCDPVKRSHKFVRRAIHLNPSITDKDTVVYRDTLISDFKPFSDTIFIRKGDTIIQERSVVRELYMSPDTIILSGVCAPDTFYVATTKYVDRVVVEAKDLKTVRNDFAKSIELLTELFLVILGIVVIVVVRSIIKGMI